MPDLFKRTMLKTCQGFKKVTKKTGKSWGGGGGLQHRPSGMEIPGWWEGLRLNDHPWGDMDIFWKHTID